MTIRKCEPVDRGYGYVVRDLREFHDSDWECAEVDLNGRACRNVYTTYRTILLRHVKKFPDVAVMSKGGHLYLVRKEQA